MTHFEISDDELSTEILHDEIERLRAVLDKTASDLSDEIARSLKAEAALARVRAEIDAIDDGTMTGDGWAVWNRIMNALDGE